MTGFGELSSSRGFQKTYQKAEEVIRSYTSPSHSLRVLDVGGGMGYLGRALQDTGQGVDYVNIDLDEEALKRSPGKTIVEDSVFMYEALRDEQLFDVVALLNYDPHIEQGRLLGDFYTNGTNPEFHRFWKSQTYERLRNQHLGISITSSSLLLREGGIFLMSGIFPEDAIDFISDLAYLDSLDIYLEADIPSCLDRATALKFAEYDTGGDLNVPVNINLAEGSIAMDHGVEGRSPEKVVEFYQNNHRLLVFRLRYIDRGRVSRHLEMMIEGHKATVDMYTNPHLDDEEIMSDF